MPEFRVIYEATAIADLDSLPRKIAAGLVKKIGRLESGLHGDIKRLKDFDPAYRLRMGDHRVLFDVDGQTVTIYRIKNRRDAYE